MCTLVNTLGPSPPVAYGPKVTGNHHPKELFLSPQLVKAEKGRCRMEHSLIFSHGVSAKERGSGPELLGYAVERRAMHTLVPGIDKA